MRIKILDNIGDGHPTVETLVRCYDSGRLDSKEEVSLRWSMY